MATQARRYLAVLGVTFALLLVCAGLVSLYVDPYRLFYVPGRLEDASARPRAIQHITLTKTFGVRHVDPRTLIIGNSRAEIGFDPLSPAWPPDWRPVYNAAIPGGWLKNDVDLLALTLREGHVRYAFIGLEFLDFLADTHESSSDGRVGEPLILASYKESLGTLISLDSLIDSLLTLQSRRDPFAANITAFGFNPHNEYRLYARREGYRALFAQRDAENARAYARLPKNVFPPGAVTSPSWRQLERLLSLAAKYDIKIVPFIYPYHAHTLELFHAAGLWPAFETWKLHLVKILEEHSDRFQTDCGLWDFSGYHTYARERVPDSGQLDAEMQWYWEGGHFKSSLGERMLERMLGSNSRPDPDFGECLSATNVQGRIESVRAGRRAYIAHDPSTVAEMSRLTVSSQR